MNYKRPVVGTTLCTELSHSPSEKRCREAYSEELPHFPTGNYFNLTSRRDFYMSEDHIILSPITLVIYHQLHCSSCTS